MPAATIPDSQQCHQQILPGRALTLRPRGPMQLRVIAGRAWITTAGAQQDLVLSCAAAPLVVARGERVVLEPFDGVPVVVRAEPIARPASIPGLAVVGDRMRAWLRRPSGRAATVG